MLLHRYPLLVFAVPGAACLLAALGLTLSRPLHRVAVDAAWGLCSTLALGMLGAPRVHRAEQLRRSGIAAVDGMSGVQFEQRLKSLFRELGYRVSTTAVTGDYGADLVLERDGVRSVVQAKRYDTPVGVEAIYQVVAAKAHYGASEAVVVTNSTYTPAALTLADDNGVATVERAELVELLARQGADDDSKSGPALLCRQVAAGVRPAFTYAASAVSIVGVILLLVGLKLLGYSTIDRNRLTRLRHRFGDYALLSGARRALGSAHR